MAKISMVERDKKRAKMVKNARNRRSKLKKTVMDKNVSMEERFEAQLKLSEMARNSSRVRMRNRCALTGRPRGYYRKFKLSRIALRQLASLGMIPGVIKSSW